MALRKVKGAVERVFDKNLNDLVRGIRAHKEDEAKFIATCIDEIKLELRQESMDVKANAVIKLVYLQMLGYDISWACFNMVEVTSSPKFTFKRTGYLAASQAFREDTDVIMLMTNLIKKDLVVSNQMYDAANSLTGLSCFMTPELAQDLTQDIMTLLSSSKPYIRKKAVLIMYKVFLKYPEALRLAYPKLKERLDDSDPGVQCAAVNVICELARKNPKNYLALAPIFFRIMTNSTNNWMLIKIIKLFGALTPLEPRLGRKLVEPLTNLIHSTSAMSLLYECINTVVAVLISISSGLPQHNSSIQLCVEKLKILIEDNDQNLKYLGLLAMGNILKTHPKSIQPLKDLVLSCLDDKDESIRFRALDLLYGMINKKNLMEIVKKLMSHIEKAEGTQYRDELLSKVIEVCSHDNYKHITNFEWYISILVELTKMEGTRHGKLISAQMLDVAVRVRSIRQYAVTQMALLVENSNLLSGAIRRNGISEVLYAAGWIAGEFNVYLSDPKVTLMAMLRERVVELPANVQSVYVQNALKLYSKLMRDMRASCEDLSEEEATEVRAEMKELTSDVLNKLPQFANSPHMEVQERACVALQILRYIERYIDKDEEIVEDFRLLFAEDLNPVAPRAQRKVPVPEGLDLDEWINAPPSSSEEDDVPGAASTFVDDRHYGAASGNRAVSSDANLGIFSKPKEVTEEDLARAREEREKYVSNNMYYLKSSNASSKTSSPPGKKMSGSKQGGQAPESSIAAELDLKLEIPGFSLTEAEKKAMKKSSKKRKGKKSKGGAGDDGAAETLDSDAGLYDSDGVGGGVGRGEPVVDIVAEDMPEGALPSDEEDKAGHENDPHRLLNFELETVAPFEEKPEKKKKKKKEEESMGDIAAETKSGKKKKGGTSSEDKTKTKGEKGESGSSSKKKKAKDIEEPDAMEDEEEPVSKKKESRSKRDKTSKGDKAPSSSTGEKDKEGKGSSSSGVKERKSKRQQGGVSTEEKSETAEVVAVGDKKGDKKEKSKKKKLLKEIAGEDDQEQEKIRDSEEQKLIGGTENGNLLQVDLIGGFSTATVSSHSLVDMAANGAKHKHSKHAGKISKSESESAIVGVSVGDSMTVDGSSSDLYLALDGIHLSPVDPQSHHLSLPLFTPLAQDNNVNVEYKLEVEPVSGGDVLAVTLKLTNSSDASQLVTLKNVELILSDGVNLHMRRIGASSAHEALLVTKRLMGGECVDKRLEYTFKDIYWPQKLKGTLTYIAASEDGSTQDKVDFKLAVPVSAYLMPLPMDGITFKNLLSSGELVHKSSILIQSAEIFGQALAKITHHVHFSVVEQIVESASLYCKSAFGDHLCALFKANPQGGFSCDMKCNHEQLTKQVQAEIEGLFQPAL
ncbi:AP-3 complex subunit delta-1-like isoform X2 [Convolutriloba macropyga]|uniref:AP-3 complex subunit delta-1-like isoform X2 n=1 Tax=Convolutriloba macropyga TaxID=536237 RepID=UPI003F51B9DB